MINNTRREILRGSVAIAGLGVLGLPEWALPAARARRDARPVHRHAGDRQLRTRPPDRRLLDIRKIDGPFTPKDQFFTTQHYGHPEVDPATFRLKVTGLVDQPMSLSLDELRRCASTELVAGFECSGNRRPLQGLCGNGRWTGVPLRTVLEQRRRQGRGAGVRLLRRRSRRGGRRVPHAERSRSTSSSAAACRARRRCRPSRSWPTR